MALIKQTQLATGITADYWRVIGMNIDYLRSVGVVHLGLYLNEAARREGKEPVHIQSVTWDGTNFPFDVANLEKQNAIAIAYEGVVKPRPNAKGEETNYLVDAKKS